MKNILKNILLVYVWAFMIFLFGASVLLPTILSVILKDDRYMCLYIITLPTVLGIIFTYINKTLE